MEYTEIKTNIVAGAGAFRDQPSLDMLPPPTTTRWIARRKAAVVAAVDCGLLTLDEACERYSLSVQELLSWQRGIERAGLLGLRATKVQHYRNLWEQRGN